MDEPTQTEQLPGNSEVQPIMPTAPSVYAVQPRSAFAFTKLKVILAFVLAYPASIFAAAMIIVGADSGLVWLVSASFFVNPPVTWFLGQVLGGWTILANFFVEAVYIYLWFSLFILFLRFGRAHKMIGFSIIAVIAIVVGAFAFHEANVCRVSEESTPRPPELVNTTITLTMDEFIAIGPELKHLDGCTPMLSAISNEIITHDDIDNGTIGSKYYTDKGFALHPLLKGTTFKIVKIIRTKDFAHTLDYLVLSDSQGTLYKLFEDYLTALGIPGQPVIMTFLGTDGQQYPLGYEYFYNYKKQQISN